MAWPPPRILTWEGYVSQQLGLANTYSWFYVPLLFDALGVPRHQRFHLPDRWNQWVSHYKTLLRANNITAEGTVIHKYIEIQRQEVIMALDQQTQQAIRMWIIGLRNNRREGVPGVLPLPDIDYNSVVQAIPGVGLGGIGRV